jgi:hypothetical protein
MLACRRGARVRAEDGIYAPLRSRPRTICTDRLKKRLATSGKSPSCIDHRNNRTRAGKLAAGFFIWNFRIGRRPAFTARISPCRCIDARGALSSRRPSLVVHASCLICRHARTCRCGARWKSAAARGPARDKVRAPNDRARCRSCRIFYSVTFTKPDHGERLFRHGQVKIPHRNSLAGAKPPARRSVC